MKTQCNSDFNFITLEKPEVKLTQNNGKTTFSHQNMKIEVEKNGNQLFSTALMKQVKIIRNGTVLIGSVTNDDCDGFVCIPQLFYAIGKKQKQ